MKGISFNGQLFKITTTVDGGWRITIDVPQSELEAIMELSKCRDEAITVGIVSTSNMPPKATIVKTF